MSAKDAGYLIPYENITPVSDRCLKVFIPDDPLYVQAFIGAYTFFGTWLAWERDTAKTGTMVASRWAGAIEKTLIALGDDCDMGSIADLERRILELENMNVCVSCCCCGSGSGNLDPYGGIDPPTDYGSFPPELPSGIPTGAAQSYTCDVAHYLADAFEETFISFRSLFGISTISMAGINAILAKFPFYVPANIVATVTTALMGAVNTTSVFDQLVGLAGGAKAELISAIVNANTPYEAKTAWDNVILDQTQYAWLVRQIVYWVAQMLDWETFLQDGAVTIPAEFQGSSCTFPTPGDTFVAFSVDENWVIPSFWTTPNGTDGRITPAGIENVPSKNRCSQWGWCEDGVQMDESGLIYSDLFTVSSNKQVVFRGVHGSDFAGTLHLEIWGGGVLVHDESIASSGNKWTAVKDVTVTGYTLVAGTDYQIKFTVPSGNKNWIVGDLDLTSV